MVAQAVEDDPYLFKTFLFHARYGVGVELLLQENSLENYLRLAETRVSGISAEWKHSSAQSGAGLQSLADQKHRPLEGSGSFGFIFRMASRCMLCV